MAPGRPPIPGSAGKVTPKQRADELRKKAKAHKLTAKRWSLQHAALAGGRDDDDVPIQVNRASSVSPAVLSTPKRVVALSDRSDREREGTPSQVTSIDLLRQRAGSLKPRSSLPMHLAPAPRRDWSPINSQEPDFEPELDQGYEPEIETASQPESSTTRSAAKANGGGKGKGKSLLVNRAPRSSLPSNLGNRRTLGDMGPPLSTERPRTTRADKGKGVDLAAPQSSRLILTRGDKARGAGGSASPHSGRLSSRRSLPALRAASALPSISRIGDITTRQMRNSQPPSSQPSPRRLVPEVEIFVPRRSSLSVSQPTRQSRSQSVPKPARPSRSAPAPARAPIRANRPTTKIKPTFKPTARPKAKPRPKPQLQPKKTVMKQVRVVIPIRRKRRARLIVEGIYDPFRDDDSSDEEPVKRYGHSGLRPKVPLPRGSKARTARPQEPEVVSLRFVAAKGPNEAELEEPFRSALAEETILKRTCEHECGWKGCDAVLASEWHLRRHVDLRRHAEQGVFKAGVGLLRLGLILANFIRFMANKHCIVATGRIASNLVFPLWRD